MIQLISTDTSVAIIDEVDVESLSTLNANQIKWLTRMVHKGQVTENAVATINDHVTGFMEAADESTDEPIDEAVDEATDHETSEDSE